MVSTGRKDSSEEKDSRRKRDEVDRDGNMPIRIGKITFNRRKSEFKHLPRREQQKMRDAKQ